MYAVSHYRKITYSSNSSNKNNSGVTTLSLKFIVISITLFLQLPNWNLKIEDKVLPCDLLMIFNFQKFWSLLSENKLKNPSLLFKRLKTQILKHYLSKKQKQNKTQNTIFPIFMKDNWKEYASLSGNILQHQFKNLINN